MDGRPDGCTDSDDMEQHPRRAAPAHGHTIGVIGTAHKILLAGTWRPG